MNREELRSKLQVSGVQTGAELAQRLEHRRSRAPLATHVELFDRLQGGGLPRGSLIELYGRRSSGRFALALAALASATAAGEPAVLIDPGDQLDPEGAKLAGVELKKLLWIRPLHAREALACAEALLGAGFSLVVLDLGESAGAWRRTPRAAWLRLARTARAQNGVLLLISSAPLADTASDVVIGAQKARTEWDRAGKPELLSGVAARLSVERRRGLPPQTGTLSLSGPS